METKKEHQHLIYQYKVYAIISYEAIIKNISLVSY